MLTACNSMNTSSESSESKYASAEEMVDYFELISVRMQDVKMMDDSLGEVGIGFYKQQVSKADALSRIQQTYDFIDTLKEGDSYQKTPYTPDVNANKLFDDIQDNLELLLDNEKESADLLKQSIETNDSSILSQIVENRKAMFAAMEKIQGYMNSFASLSNK